MSGLNVSQQTDNLASVTIFNDIVKVNQNSPIFPVNCLSSLILAGKLTRLSALFFMRATSRYYWKLRRYVGFSSLYQLADKQRANSFGTLDNRLHICVGGVRTK